MLTSDLNMFPDEGIASDYVSPPVTKSDPDDLWDISDGAVCLAAGIARTALGCRHGYDPVRALVWKFEPQRGIASRIPKPKRFDFLMALENAARTEHRAQREDRN